MKWLLQYATRVAVRRVVGLLVLAVLAWAGIGRAQAAQPPAYNNLGTRADAYAACVAFADYSKTVNQSQNYQCYLHPTIPTTKRYACATGGYSGPPCYGQSGFGWVAECPIPGQMWSEVTKRCNPPCSERNAGMTGKSVNSFQSKCFDGCTLAMEPGGTTTAFGGVTGTETLYSGSFRYTGATCIADPPEPPPPPKTEECRPAGSGQTMCVRNDGSHCASASNGVQFCWKPGETGQKSHGPQTQVSNAGNQPIAPNLNLPNGDTLAQNGSPTNVSSTTGGNTSNTTIHNYNTVNGTNAGGGAPNEGSPQPGSPGYTPPGPNGPSGPGSGGDDGKDQPGTASGGETCESGPISSDPVIGMVATQAWATRCAVEAGNAASVSGDVGDCKSPFTVQGTNANAEKLRALRASICGIDKLREDAQAARDADKAERDAKETAMGNATGSIDGDADALESEFGTNVFGEGGEGVGLINSSLISWGGGACPNLAVTVPGVGTWTLPPEACAVIAALAALFQLIAYMWALRNIAEG